MKQECQKRGTGEAELALQLDMDVPTLQRVFVGQMLFSEPQLGAVLRDLRMGKGKLYAKLDACEIALQQRGYLVHRSQDGWAMVAVSPEVLAQVVETVWNGACKIGKTVAMDFQRNPVPYFVGGLLLGVGFLVAAREKSKNL